MLRAAVRHEVDAAPGLISLSRAQSSRLVDEQALQGKDSVWGAAHMIEGVVSANEDGRIKVSLRLETFKDGTSTKTDAEAIGDAASIGETTAAAWRKLMDIPENPLARPNEMLDARARALSEGRRLMREAEWLHSLDADPTSCFSLVESAVALGVPAEETITLHLDLFFRQFRPFRQRSAYPTNGLPATDLQNLREISRDGPGSLALSDELAHLLPTARRFLQQTSWYLERSGSDSFKGVIDYLHLFKAYKSNEIWYAIQALSYIRTMIDRKQLSDMLGNEFETFSNELDELTRRYFSLLQSVPNPSPDRYFIVFQNACFLQRNPALVDCMVTMAAKGASLSTLLCVSSYTNLEGLERDRSLSRWMVPRKYLAGKIIERIGDDPSPRMRLAKADLECFVAASGERPKAVRHLMEVFAEAREHSTGDETQADDNLLSQNILNACTTSFLFDRNMFNSFLEHGGSLIPTLLLSPRPAPDLLLRQRTYQKSLHALRFGRIGKQEANPAVDPFREMIHSYDSYELKRLKALAADGKKSSDPGGIVSSPVSRNLVSLIYGSGKTMDPTGKPVEDPPAPKPLKATLLADLRTDESPGVIIWPLVDNVNSDRLWTFYFPSTQNGIRVDQRGGAAPQSGRLKYEAPWLLAIDCRDGSVIRKVDLHSAVGEAYGLDLSHRQCSIWSMAFDQTRSRILTNVGWSEQGWSSNKMGSVIIDKATGTPHPLPGNPEILKGQMHSFHELWYLVVGVVGVGEHFFYLNRGSEQNGGAIQGVKTEAMTIFQVAPDLSVSPLTVAGRRPEKTPFDSTDRAPFTIIPHDDRLLAINQSTLADYDPRTADWSVMASMPSAKPFKDYVTPVADSNYWNFLRSIHEVRMDGKTTEWIAVDWPYAPKAGLTFASRNHEARTLPIEAVIPQDFLESTYAIEEVENGKPEDRKTLFKDHPRFQNPGLVVLDQTDKDLILGVQTNNYYEWERPSRNTTHLPFLWKVSKQEIFEILQTHSTR